MSSRWKTIPNLSQVTRGQERDPTTTPLVPVEKPQPPLQITQSRDGSRTSSAQSFWGKSGTFATSHLPTWSGKRDPTCPGALLTLGSYIWLAHLVRSHQIPAVHSTQEGIPMIPPSKELKVWCVHSHQSGSWSHHLSTTVHCPLQEQLLFLLSVGYPLEGLCYLQ